MRSFKEIGDTFYLIPTKKCIVPPFLDESEGLVYWVLLHRSSPIHPLEIKYMSIIKILRDIYGKILSYYEIRKIIKALRDYKLIDTWVLWNARTKKKALRIRLKKEAIRPWTIDNYSVFTTTNAALLTKWGISVKEWDF